MTEAVKKPKMPEGLFGMPNVTLQTPISENRAFYSSSINPFNKDTAAGIAWDVGKSGGIVDRRLAEKAIKQGFPAELLVSSSGTSSGWTSRPDYGSLTPQTLPVTNTPSQTAPNPNPWGNNPQTGGYWPNSQGWPSQPVFPYPQQPQTFPKQKSKVEYSPEQIKGRFCAHVIATTGDATHTGLLFVKKCGAWKILEYNGNKLVGGGIGSFEDMLKSGELKLVIINTIYDADRVEQNDEMDLEIS